MTPQAPVRGVRSLTDEAQATYRLAETGLVERLQLVPSAEGQSVNRFSTLMKEALEFGRNTINKNFQP